MKIDWFLIGVFAMLILFLVLLNMEIIYIIACVVTAISGCFGGYWAVHRSLRKERDSNIAFRQHMEDNEKYTTHEIKKLNACFMAVNTDVKDTKNDLKHTRDNLDAKIDKVLDQLREQQVAIARLEEKINALQNSEDK